MTSKGICRRGRLELAVGEVSNRHKLQCIPIREPTTTFATQHTSAPIAM